MALEAPVTEAQQKKPEIWVRPDHNPKNIGQMLVNSIKEDRRIILRAIGAGAVNQAVKGVIEARVVLGRSGEDLFIRPGFTTVEGTNGEDVTAVVLHCSLM